jgi:ectoine hydroxylase-related dioxygenase (phytanoyl-CoA dioxygenase family)
MFDPISQQELEQFSRDGFLIRENVLSKRTAEQARARFEHLFAGEFATGLAPDEVNWQAGRDPNDVTRQICNAWKADPTLARILLSESLGQACATLMDWPGTRLNQDNIFWKPPGGKALGFHQDSSYEQWVVPHEMVSCWIALDDTYAKGGTVEYVRGSHRWPLDAMIESFHAPEDPLQEMRRAAEREGVTHPEIVPIEVPAGGCVFHHGHTWHGSRANLLDTPRRSIVAHCMSSAARFSESNTGAIYSRYQRFGDTSMDESFFPILWRDDGHRSAFLEDFLSEKIGWGGVRPTT